MSTPSDLKMMQTYLRRQTLKWCRNVCAVRFENDADMSAPWESKMMQTCLRREIWKWCRHVCAVSHWKMMQTCLHRSRCVCVKMSDKGVDVCWGRMIDIVDSVCQLESRTQNSASLKTRTGACPHWSQIWRRRHVCTSFQNDDVDMSASVQN